MRAAVRTGALAVAIAVVALSLPATAQKADPDMEKLAAQYQALYNKADVKGLVAMYTADAIRVGPDGQMVKGHAAIEQGYAGAFAGPLKGATLTLTTGSAHAVSPDVKLMEGRYSTAGSAPVKGRYVNTVVRQSGKWLLASVVTIPDPAPPK